LEGEKKSRGIKTAYRKLLAILKRQTFGLLDHKKDLKIPKG
jgi:hypothetical protein